MSKRECDLAMERLTAFVEGWLDAHEERELEQHLSVCAECQREFVREQRLRTALDVMPPVPVVAPAWSDVLQRRQSAPKRPAWLRPALGFAGAAAALALGILLVLPSTQGSTESAVAADSDLDPYVSAHTWASWDTGGDPSRAIVLASLGSDGP